MRFAVYHPWIYLTGGAERVLENLLHHSDHDWLVLTHHFDGPSTFPRLRDAPLHEFSPRVSVERSLPALAQAAWRIARTRVPPVDALLLSSEGLGDLMMARNDLPTVVYCHTPLKIVNDPVTRAALREQSAAKARAVDLLAPGFRAVDRRMWRRFTYRFANSHETRRRIEAAGLAGSGEVEVLPPGVDMARFSGPGRPRPWRFLVAGRIMWQKNIELAIEALRLATERDLELDVELVIAGKLDEKSRPYLAELRRAAEGLPVEFVIDPDDDTLSGLYQRSSVLIFTPPNEDFGIVPLEAMSAGLPVLAVDGGGARETIEHGVSGWLLPPEPLAFAHLIRKMTLAGVSPRMRWQARARAATFGWEPFVSRIDEVMTAVAAGHAVPPSDHATHIDPDRGEG